MVESTVGYKLGGKFIGRVSYLFLIGMMGGAILGPLGVTLSTGRVRSEISTGNFSQEILKIGVSKERN